MTTRQAEELNRVLSPDEFLKLNPELKIELKRELLNGDIHQQYLELRKKIYNEVKWTNGDCWDEEITPYKEHEVFEFEDVYSFIENVNFDKIKLEDYILLKPILEEKKQRDKYNVKTFMKKNWNK